MNKQNLEEFIQKYTLGGLIEEVRWDTDGNNISVSATNQSKSIMAFVTARNLPIDSGTYNIYETSRLRSLLSVLEDDINVDIISQQGIPVYLKFGDGSNVSFKYHNAEPEMIPESPSTPPLDDFEMEMTVDSDFMQRFVKGSSALSHVTSVVLIADEDPTRFVIGYDPDHNTTRVSLEVESFGELKKNFSFSAPTLKNIFLANKGLEEAKIRVSDIGILYIGFDNGEYKCDYYLPKLTHIGI